MSASLCDWNEVTATEVVELIDRFLPPGQSTATTRGDEFIVTWASRDRSDRVFEGRSNRSFDDAYHRLIAKCARQSLENAAKNATKFPANKASKTGRSPASFPP